MTYYLFAFARVKDITNNVRGNCALISESDSMFELEKLFISERMLFGDKGISFMLTDFNPNLHVDIHTGIPLVTYEELLERVENAGI